MKIPDKLYEPELIIRKQKGTISYYTSLKDNSDTPKEIKLPDWLTNCIVEECHRAYIKG